MNGYVIAAAVYWALTWAVWSAAIAERKGYDGVGYFFGGLIFGPIGAALAYLKEPNHAALLERERTVRANLIAARRLKACPHCTEAISTTAKVCPHCAQEV